MKDLSEQVILLILGGIITVCGTVTGAFLWWLIRTVINATKEIAVLNSKIETMFSNAEAIPKIKSDLNALHDWRRKMDGKQ